MGSLIPAGELRQLNGLRKGTHARPQFEATLILATLVQDGHMRLMSDDVIKPAVIVVLRPSVTLAMRFD